MAPPPPLLDQLAGEYPAASLGDMMDALDHGIMAAADLPACPAEAAARLAELARRHLDARAARSSAARTRAAEAS